MGNRKKILYIITKSNWGGAQKYVYDLTANLPKEKFETAIVVGNQGLFTEKLTEKKIRVINLPGITKDINFLQEVRSFFSLLKIFAKEKPDVVHLNSSKFGGLGALAARLSSLVISHSPLVIFTAHGWPFNEDRNFMARGIIYFFSWLTAVLADRIINIAKTDYKQSLKFPLLPQNKFIYIPNGIGFEDQHFLPAAEARNTFGIDKNEIVIGSIAELTKNKGLIHLVDAINQMKFKVHPAFSGTKFKIVIIGEGEDREKIQHKITSLGLQDTIYLAGFTQDAEKYLKGFDIFVLPSTKEGLPYVLLEAMAAGLPIIASRVGGIPDLIEHEKNGFLVEPKDYLGLAAALEKMIQNLEKYKILGEEARKTIGTKFSFHAMLTKTARLYE